MTKRKAKSQKQSKSRRKQAGGRTAPRKSPAYHQKKEPSDTSTKFPHFRKYKQEEGSDSQKVRHPKLIVSEDHDDFEFLGLTESKKRGHHNNFPLLENPQKGEKEKPAYLREELRTAPKSRFGKPLDNYELSEVDKPRVSSFLEKLLGKKETKKNQKR